MTAYHRPVMLEECLEGLRIRPDGIYVDATFGGGGHSKAILERLGEKGRLLAFDRDTDVTGNIPADNRFIFVHSDYRYLKKFLRLNNVHLVDGILADLGVSSYQFDTPARGFSYRYDAPLDMRMDRGQSLTAADILNSYSAKDLQSVFSSYGELRNARSLSLYLTKVRNTARIETTGQLVELLAPMVIGDRMKYLSQVFQALRIEVNRELDSLKEFLEGSAEVLRPEGRLVILTYHSLEDRLVKNYFRQGVFEGEAPRDLYGNVHRPLQPVNRKPMVAGREEIEENSRARSAKLRIAEKVN